LVSVDSEVVSIIVAVYNVAPYLADCVGWFINLTGVYPMLAI